MKIIFLKVNILILGVSQLYKIFHKFLRFAIVFIESFVTFAVDS